MELEQLTRAVASIERVTQNFVTRDGPQPQAPKERARPQRDEEAKRPRGAYYTPPGSHNLGNRQGNGDKGGIAPPTAYVVTPKPKPVRSANVGGGTWFGPPRQDGAFGADSDFMQTMQQFAPAAPEPVETMAPVAAPVGAVFTPAMALYEAQHVYD